MQNLKKMSSHTISDSFLRSYSLSRIVKINEQNRNKAKVTVMRKIKAIKQQNRKKYQNFEKLVKSQKQAEINLENKTKLIDCCDSNIMTPQVQKQTQRKQIQTKEVEKMNKNVKKIQSTKLHHRRLQSDILLRRSLNDAQNQRQQNQNKKMKNYDHLKAQLRRSQISFQRSYRLQKKWSPQKRRLQLQPIQTLNSPLQAAITSFNRLKLMTNTSSRQKIMEHFYKRSLENCTLDDIKYLLKMQKDKKRQQNDQNSSIPMRFGKVQSNQKSILTPIQNNDVEDVDSKCRRTVWNNEILKKNCSNDQNSKINNLRHKKFNKFDKLFKINTSQVQNQIKQFENMETMIGQKQNRQNIANIGKKSLQIEQNIIYCFRDKRFPTSDNKLSSLYENLQKSYIRKKFFLNQKSLQNPLKIVENRQLKAKSIRIKESYVSQQGIENKNCFDSIQSHQQIYKLNFQNKNQKIDNSQTNQQNLNIYNESSKDSNAYSNQSSMSQPSLRSMI